MNRHDKKTFELALIQHVKRRDYANMEKMLATGIDPDSCVAGMTAMHVAVCMNDVNLVQWLHAHKASVNVKDKKGKTPLHYAMHSISMLGVLVANGADVNVPDRKGQTLVHHAAKAGEPVLVLNFVEHGGDLLARDKNGKTPLELVPGGDVTAFLQDMAKIRARRIAQEKKQAVAAKVNAPKPSGF